jgi:hypothetical protein
MDEMRYSRQPGVKEERLAANVCRDARQRMAADISALGSINVAILSR